MYFVVFLIDLLIILVCFGVIWLLCFLGFCELCDFGLDVFTYCWLVGYVGFCVILVWCFAWCIVCLFYFVIVCVLYCFNCLF